MLTKNQLFKNKRKQIIKKNRSFLLNKNPQVRGICLSTEVRSPKKPNSAKRKVAKIKILKTKKILTVFLPGQNARVSVHDNVLIHGGRASDLPGIKYRVLRGVLNCNTEEGRKKRRSFFAIKKT